MARIELVKADSGTPRDGVGGRPWLPVGGWPVCRNEHFLGEDGPERCPHYGSPLAHFFRFDVQAHWGLPLPAGAHVSVFLCLACADTVLPLGRGQSAALPGFAAPGRPLPPVRLDEAFWEGDDEDMGWWDVLIFPPDTALEPASEEPAVAPAGLRFWDEPDGPGVSDTLSVVRPEDRRLGPRDHRCGCGAAMVPLLRLPAELVFPALPGAPEQFGTFSDQEYSLFRGNTTWILACSRSCNPRATWPVCGG